MMNPMRILVHLVPDWKFLEIISRCCTTLSEIGCICTWEWVVSTMTEGTRRKRTSFRSFFSYIHVSFDLFSVPASGFYPQWLAAHRENTHFHGSLSDMSKETYIHIYFSFEIFGVPWSGCYPWWLGQPGKTTTHTFVGCSHFYSYGVASMSRLLKITGLFCRISSLL